MAEQTGSTLYLKFGTTVLSADFRSWKPDEGVDLVDASAGADTNKSYIATLQDGSASCALVYQSGGTAAWAALKQGTAGTLEWGEEGTATGKPKHTVQAIVKKRSKDVPYENLIVINVDFQFNGAVADGSY